jgi:hypothetical protein
MKHPDIQEFSIGAGEEGNKYKTNAGSYRRGCVKPIAIRVYCPVTDKKHGSSA